MPPAPAGLIWYKYAPGVPPLPTVSSVLGSAYTGYTWIYDSNYASSSFQFSNLDKVRLPSCQGSAPCPKKGFRGASLLQPCPAHPCPLLPVMLAPRSSSRVEACVDSFVC